MNKIYVSFSTYIAKYLRKELGEGSQPINIPPHLRSLRYWRSRGAGAYASLAKLKRMPTIRELFIRALRLPEKKYPYYAPYSLAFSEEEYNAMSASDDKREELVAFQLPAVIPYGEVNLPTNPRTLMAQIPGEQLRKAFIYYFYEQFAAFLHRYQMECVETMRPFTVVEAIAQFADVYDYSSNEQYALRGQYYRYRLQHQSKF